MKIQKKDFRFVREGQTIRSLKDEDLPLLETIDKKGPGKTRALLLLHGFSSSPAVFREFVPELLPYYDAIYCPLLPGHGQSIEAFSKVRYSDWIAVAEKACEKLSNQYQELDVLGLSLGGLLAYHLSQKFKLRHLYLLAPAFDLIYPVNWTLAIAKCLKFLGFQQFGNKAGNLKNPEASELSYIAMPLASLIEIFSFIQSINHKPLSCPTDLFLGSLDRVIDAKKVEARFLESNNAKIHWLNDSAHLLPLDNDRHVILHYIKQQAAS